MSGRPLSLIIYLPNLEGGGVERMKINLSEVFLERGVDVTFLLHKAEGQLIPLVPDGARVAVLGAHRTLAALPLLTAYLRRERPDVLFSSLGHNNVISLWARSLARVPTRVIVSQHNALTRESAALANWQHRALPALYRAFLPLADAIVAVSEGVADDMAKATGIDRRRITVIHNPVLSRELTNPATESVPHRWLDDPTCHVFVAMGRLVPQKDFATLLRAFARLPPSLRARLLILGEGPLRAELEALSVQLGVSDLVQLPGFQQNPLPYVSRARALVLSSTYEGFGNVLVEALACGTPVVSTDCPYGPSEILDGGRFGKLVPVGDASALAAAMEAVVSSPPSSAVLRQRADMFRLEHGADRYLALFRAVVEGVERRRERAPSSSASRPGLSGTSVRSVAIYVPNLASGGAEVTMSRLAHGLTERGIGVTMLVHGADEPRIEEAPSVEVVDLGVQHSLAALPGLVRHLRRRRPDVLLTAFPHNNIIAVMARALARVPVSVVLTEHSVLSLQIRLRRGSPRYQILPWILPTAYRHCDAVVAVSCGVRDDLARLLGTRRPRLDVIHNPVLPTNWQALADEPVHHPWLVAGGPPVVLCVARLSAEKNLPTLVRAFATLRRRQPAARLLVLGKGPERRRLEELVAALDQKEAVDLLGWVGNVLPYMQRARVLVLSSNFEGFGNVLVEAMACGTNVVSTDCPFGPAEILEGGRFGNLVPVGDVDALARAMESAVNAPGAPPGGMERALEFTVERSIAEYLNLFDQLRSGPSAGAGQAVLMER